MSPPDPAGVLGRTFALRSLEPGSLDALAAGLALRSCASGETVARAGDPADGWHFVLTGRARLADATSTAGTWPTQYVAGEAFGERSLIEDFRWPGTLRADGPLELATLSRAAFDTFAAGLPPGDRQTLRQRIAQQADFDFLRRINIFGHLASADTERLFGRLERVHLPRGSCLYFENAPSDAGYVIRQGRLRLVTTVGGSRRQLAVRRAGDLVGEIELLYGTPRMADAVADSDCELFALSRALFDELTPRERDRDALYQLATDRLLQYQNALSEADSRTGQDALPDLTVSWLPAPGHRYGRTYPVVTAESAVTAGLACLAMVDAAHRRDSQWQDRVEQFLWDRAPDTLLTLSAKAEQCGYLTHMVTDGQRALAQVPLPGIIEDADGSLAVLSRAARGTLVVVNPRTGIRSVPARAFASTWNGRALLLSATAPGRRYALLREYARPLAAIAVVSLLTQVFGIGGPLAGSWIIDRVLVDGDQSLLGLLLVGMLAMLGFHVAASALREYLVAHTSGRIGLALQLRFFDRVMRLPPEAAASFQAGDLAVRFRENDTLVRETFRAGLSLVVDSVSLVVHLAVLAALNLPLAAVAVMMTAVNAAASLLAASAARGSGLRLLAARKSLHAHLMETIAGIHTVKALVLEQAFLARGLSLMTRYRAGMFRDARLAATIDLGGRVLHNAAIVAVLGYGAVLTLRGEATTGRLFATIGVFGAMLGPVSGLQRSRDAQRRARDAWAQVSAVASLEIRDTEATSVAPVLTGHVEYRHVSFRYPGALEDALTDVSLEVLPGQTVALVGRSGSGKTTLVNLLMGLHDATRGTIALDQIDIRSIPKSALRRQLGVVEQHPFLFNGTIRENISKLDPTVPFDRIVTAARMAGAHDFIDALPEGYDTRIGERGVTLSGGERQRLVIARALVGDPRMLLLDEATSAIDSRMERAIHGAIGAAHGHRTVFVIAHRLSTVRDADVIVVLDQGRIVETGTHEELTARRGLYAYLHSRFV